ncbi:hypothetical protein EUTSA_v10009461mg [Eutrema salsugineum]|uniref:F-box domain-containing protein n=1 Tax=Eutrema salsugineum TaxID=72664 RepID=V4KSV8_EUTSA|nr:F-box protein SKIP22 [Eutrema salsugineum]ESQ34409.1 hypothetical protein EUTSA_v10009461mg [Eutrema salsugineum]
MKLRLRRHETRETLKLELADTATLHDLRRRIISSAPSSVHLSLNRKDELLAPSPEDTLRSLGVTSGDLVYYSLDRSAFVTSVEEIGLASSAEADQVLAPSGESSDGKLGDSATSRGPQSERSHDSMGIEFAEVDVDMNIHNQARTDPNSVVEDPAEGSIGENPGMEGPEPMDVEQLDVELAAAGSIRLSEPFFLKKILLEKSGDTSELTTLALSVHAVMLESGFVLLDHGSDKFSFSKELLSVSLRYTLPELITSKESNTIEFVTVRFQSLGYMVVVYGNLSGYKGQKVNLEKRRFVPVIDLVMDTLKSSKEGSSSIYREMFMFWRMVKDGLVIPLLIGLCDKAGLELPPCLMRLPTELKLKILESLPGASVAKMACVCTEMRYLASDNDLWKQKCVEEAEHLVVVHGSGVNVNWQAKFAAYWRQHHRRLRTARRTLRNYVTDRNNRIPFPRILRDPDPFGMFNGDHLHGSIGFHSRQPARGLGRRGWGRGFSPGCNLGGSN